MTSCVFGYWLFFLARPMFLLPAMEGRWPFVDFPPVAPGQLVKTTQEIFLSLVMVTMMTLDFYDDDYIPVGQRRGSCIFSLARGKSVYRLDVAMFVSLIVT